MSAETDLKTLLSTLSPHLLDEQFVFCSFPAASYGDHADLRPIGTFREDEGLTLIVPRQAADAHDIPYQSVFRAITMQVHSSLDAIGLTAALATALAKQHISANVVAGYFHDHIFVNEADAEQAMTVLSTLGA